MNFLEKFHEDLTAEKQKETENHGVDIDAIAEKVVEKLLNAEHQNNDSNEDDTIEQEESED